jgi:hypothetical protein
VAAVFDHHGFAVIDLDERQSLRQGLGGGPGGLVAELRAEAMTAAGLG